MEQERQEELLQFQLEYLNDLLVERRCQLWQLETSLEKAKQFSNTGLNPLTLIEGMKITKKKALITLDSQPAVQTNPSPDELRDCTETIEIFKEILIEEERKLWQLRESLEEAKRVTNARLSKDYHLKSAKRKVREQKHKNLSSLAQTTPLRGARASNNPPDVTPIPSWDFPLLHALMKQSDLGPEMETDCSTDEVRQAAEKVKALMKLMIEQKQKYTKLKKSYEEEKRVANTNLYNGAVEDNQRRRQHQSLSGLASGFIEGRANRLSSTATARASIFRLRERAAKQSDIKPKLETNYFANNFGEYTYRIKTLKDVVVKQQQNRMWIEKVLQESKAACSNKLYTNWLLQTVKGKRIPTPTFVPRRKLATTTRNRKNTPRSFTPPGISSETVAELNHELPDSMSKVTSWLCQ